MSRDELPKKRRLDQLDLDNIKGMAIKYGFCHVADTLRLLEEIELLKREKVEKVVNHEP